MNELMSPQAIAERRRIQDALRRIAIRYQNEGRVIEEVAIRRAIEEVFDAPMPIIVSTPFKVGEVG